MTIPSGDAAQPTLEYAPAASTVPGVTLSATGNGAVVVTVHPTARRLLRPVITFLLQMAIVAPTIAVYLFLPTGRRDTWPVWLVVFCIGFGLLTVITFFQRLVHVLHPIRWEVDPSGIAMTARRLSDVIQQRWPRQHIFDLAVERIRVKEQMFK
jgi:hypothetical protein